MPLLILIAEDDPGIRVSVSDSLEMAGYSVISADNGVEALKMVEKYHPHLLISDIKMPGKDGYELVKSIRQLPQYRLLPVILLTECANTNDRIRGYQVGCDIYLPKPFEIDELIAIVRNLLERSQIVHSELRFSHQNHQEVEPKTDLHHPIDNSDCSELLTELDLTSREQEVLQLLVKGHSNIEIGEKLHLSHRTIEKYVSSLLRKSNTSNRSELIAHALEYNFVR